MGRLGLPELLVILVIVVIIFGANRLPQLGKGIGSAIRNFKSGIGGDDEPAPSAQVGACVNCGTVNAADSRFCRKCGNKL
jgi:sec-independent protein translocase protein TatA